MQQHAFRSRIPFVYPYNKEINQKLQPSIYAVKAIKNAEVPTPKNTMDDPPQNDDATKGDVPCSTNFSDVPPPKFVSADNVPSPNVDDDLSEEIMFEDDNTTIGVISVSTAFNITQKPPPQNHVLILSSILPQKN